MQLKPIRSEKSLGEAKLGRYTFATRVQATKTDIKRAVAKLFGVQVVSVQTAVMPGHSYRPGKKYLRVSRPDWKKAIVAVKSGQKIDLFESS